MHYANALEPLSGIQSDRETIPVFARWFGSWRLSLHRRALSRPELTRSYDRAAPGWHRTLDRLGVHNAYEAMLRSALAADGPRFTRVRPRVLDCGVGTGALSSALTAVLPVPFTLEGIDISPCMLEQAATRLRKTCLDLSLRYGDIRTLPFEDGVFDLVMAAHVLEHLAEPETGLREMMRVTKPGGLVLICLTQRSPLGAYVQLKWRTLGVTSDEALNWLRAAGLENVRCLTPKRGICFRQLSVTCIGRKPLTQHKEEHTQCQ